MACKDKAYAFLDLLIVFLTEMDFVKSVWHVRSRSVDMRMM